MDEVESVFAPKKYSRVAFGSCTARKMFPVHTIPSRMGIEQGLRGEPHRGPGVYSPHPISLFLSPISSRPRSERGWLFGATLSQRLPTTQMGIKPGPADYQHTMSMTSSQRQSYKPFGTTFPVVETNKSSSQPGPGAYGYDVSQNRHVECEESFGGTKTLKNLVTVKCTLGIPDTCSKCQQELLGDHYQNAKNHILCNNCFSKRSEVTPGYYKVRDCRSIHKHEFPGRESKIILMTDKVQKKLRYREAYLKLYYT